MPSHQTIGFFDNVFDVKNGTLRCGIPGTTTRVPAGASIQTMLFVAGAGRGATDAWDGFGKLLLARAGKSRTRASASAQTSQLGYSTVGHFVSSSTVLTRNQLSQ